MCNYLSIIATNIQTMFDHHKLCNEIMGTLIALTLREGPTLPMNLLLPVKLKGTSPKLAIPLIPLFSANKLHDEGKTLIDTNR